MKSDDRSLCTFLQLMNKSISVKVEAQVSLYEYKKLLDSIYSGHGVGGLMRCVFTCLSL
jgi:hypothetical protein